VVATTFWRDYERCCEWATRAQSEKTGGKNDSFLRDAAAGQQFSFFSVFVPPANREGGIADTHVINPKLCGVKFCPSQEKISVAKITLPSLPLQNSSVDLEDGDVWTLSSQSSFVWRPFMVLTPVQLPGLTLTGNPHGGCRHLGNDGNENGFGMLME
jgi:hypothetical protein